MKDECKLPMSGVALINGGIRVESDLNKKRDSVNGYVQIPFSKIVA